MEKDLRLLQQIYKVYIDHAAMVNEYSNAFWTKFDINALTKSAEEFDKLVRRMPKEQKELGELQTFQKLEEVGGRTCLEQEVGIVGHCQHLCMSLGFCSEITAPGLLEPEALHHTSAPRLQVVTSFKAGVPLIQQLKSDAIRKVHWEER